MRATRLVLLLVAMAALVAVGGATTASELAAEAADLALRTAITEAAFRAVEHKGSGGMGPPLSNIGLWKRLDDVEEFRKLPRGFLDEYEVTEALVSPGSNIWAREEAGGAWEDSNGMRGNYVQFVCDRKRRGFMSVVSNDGGATYSWAHIQLYRSPQRQLYRAIVRYSPGGQVEYVSVDKLDREASSQSRQTDRQPLASLRCGYQKFA